MHLYHVYYNHAHPIHTKQYIVPVKMQNHLRYDYAPINMLKVYYCLHPRGCTNKEVQIATIKVQSVTHCSLKRSTISILGTKGAAYSSILTGAKFYSIYFFFFPLHFLVCAVNVFNKHRLVYKFCASCLILISFRKSNWKLELSRDSCQRYFVHRCHYIRNITITVPYYTNNAH